MRLAELPVIRLSNGWTVLLDCLVWAGWSVLCGYVVHRLPVEHFETGGPLTRLRSFERSGRFYERWFRVRRWKDLVPEAGGLFVGGFDKKHLRSRDPAYLDRFLTETRRAEVTHWAVMVLSPLFVLWNPAWLAAVMVAYGVGANLPCVIIQRFNRARLERLRRRAARVPPR